MNQDDRAFDLEWEQATSAPASASLPDFPLLIAAQSYLAYPAVYFWGAFAGQKLVGFLSCLLLPLRYGDPHELLLYEIDVHRQWRRQGVGRALIGAMEQWMQAHEVREVWVLGDNPGAVAFY